MSGSSPKSFPAAGTLSFRSFQQSALAGVYVFQLPSHDRLHPPVSFFSAIMVAAREAMKENVKDAMRTFALMDE